RYTEDPEAFQLYLKGRYSADKFTAESGKQGIEYFTQAIARDPRFALAFAGLADCYNIASSSWLSPHDAQTKSRAAAMRALELDDQLAEAHAALIPSKLFYDWDWAGAEREVQRAIVLNPSCVKA